MSKNPQSSEAIEVFYSYSHNKSDEKLKNELLKQLAGIERQGVIVSWHDRKITAGREWAGEIDEHINTAGVILLLISPDFISSGYCNDVELKRAMERHEAGEACVIPIILRPTLKCCPPTRRQSPSGLIAMRRC
jgi:TIR domain-containing protein